MTQVDLFTISVYGVLPALTLIFSAVSLFDFWRFRNDEKKRNAGLWLFGTGGLALGFGVEDAWWHKMYYLRSIGVDATWMLDAKPILGATCALVAIASFCLLLHLRTKAFGGKPSWPIALTLGLIFSGVWVVHALNSVGLTTQLGI